MPVGLMMYSKLLPTSWGMLVIREKAANVSAQVYKKEDVMRFLVRNGFTEAPYEVTNMLSYLISKAANGERLNMTKEYYELSKDSDRYADSTREILSYYIEKNLASMRQSLIRDYDTDIGEYFSGNKNFIQKISTLFVLFGV